jgi:hypothetical protein
MNDTDDTKTENLVPAPAPTIEAEFHAEPHPDPVIRALIAEVEKLRLENADLKEQLHGPHSR